MNFRPPTLTYFMSRITSSDADPIFCKAPELLPEVLERVPLATERLRRRTTTKTNLTDGALLFYVLCHVSTSGKRGRDQSSEARPTLESSDGRQHAGRFCFWPMKTPQADAARKQRNCSVRSILELEDLRPH